MRKLKWFFGEFFVVVAGVLVAFLLNSWWINIKEDRKEREYLRLIHDDLQATISNVNEAAESQRKTLHAASQLMKYSYLKELPDPMVIGNTMITSMNFSPSHQTSATLSSLVNTGELSLISNDTLRQSLGELVALLSEYSSSNNEMAYSWLLPAFERFAQVVNVADLQFQLFSEEQMAIAATDSLSGIPHPDKVLMPETIDLHSLIRQEDFRDAAILLRVGQDNLYRLHMNFLEELEATNALLEREMQRLDVEKSEEMK